jgi:sulfide:quinone oxidoreductase
VQFVGDSAGMSVNGDGSLALESGEAIAADRVVAIPKLRGQRISGVPTSWAGFVPTDSFGRVHGLPDVYAAGDMSSFAIKQGGLATQQSDRIAQVIASRLGVVVHQTRPTQVLRARLVGGANPLVLRAELGQYGSPIGASLERVDLDPEQSWIKVFGRYLTPYLETCEPIAQGAIVAG